MFKGILLDKVYYSWAEFKKSWNQAVLEGKLFDDKGNRITRTYQ